MSEALVNRTLTKPLNSDFKFSAQAPVQTAELSQDRNGMMALPKLAVVAREPSYLCYERISWSPANDKKWAKPPRQKGTQRG